MERLLAAGVADGKRLLLCLGVLAVQVLSDPVLRGLLTDPGMQRVLQECGQPGGMARHMRDPETAAKIRRLADAGLVQLG